MSLREKLLFHTCEDQILPKTSPLSKRLTTSRSPQERVCQHRNDYAEGSQSYWTSTPACHDHGRQGKDFKYIGTSREATVSSEENVNGLTDYIEQYLDWQQFQTSQMSLKIHNRQPLTPLDPNVGHEARAKLFKRLRSADGALRISRAHPPDVSSAKATTSPRKLLWPVEDLIQPQDSHRTNTHGQQTSRQLNVVGDLSKQESVSPAKSLQLASNDLFRSRVHQPALRPSRAARKYVPNFSLPKHQSPYRVYPTTRTWLLESPTVPRRLRSFRVGQKASHGESQAHHKYSSNNVIHEKMPAAPVPTISPASRGSLALRSAHVASPSRHSLVSQRSQETPSATTAEKPVEGVGAKEAQSMRKLKHLEIWFYRVVFSVVLVGLNLSMLAIYLRSPRHHYLLAFLVFMKSKDLLSTVAGILGLIFSAVRRLISRPGKVDSKWIMSLVCAYAESEEQIMKTVRSLVKQELVQHKQVICVILDGKVRDVLSHFSRVTYSTKRPYMTWKFSNGEIELFAGFIEDIPVILIQKAKNAGKKDSLILGHDLFNYAREDAPADTKNLRRDIFTHILPALTGNEGFESFDFVYATDADSVIHKNCLKELANALCRNPKAIAACGLIVAELSKRKEEWSAWHLFQQFQYTFGQYVRRQAESVWGRVTCLPGPVTMMAVRPEMASAISEYARPVTNHNIITHQVQYQGTDRRLTWCILSQNKDLQTLLVTKAIGETVVPASLNHYLSQRRRWATNTYFNDFMYAFGKQQRLITRLFAIIDIVRMSFVFYRVINTVLFIRSLVRYFYVVKIIPTLILTKTPTTWFLMLILAKEPVLRKRMHKILCGIVLNQFMSPVLSVVVFSRVLLNIGNYAWGRTGVCSKDVNDYSMAYLLPNPPKSPWSPTRLVGAIKSAIRPSPMPKHTSNSRRIGFMKTSDPSLDTPNTASKISYCSNELKGSDPCHSPAVSRKPLAQPEPPATLLAKSHSMKNRELDPISAIRRRRPRTVSAPL